jgi:hypothetical protein
MLTAHISARLLMPIVKEPATNRLEAYRYVFRQSRLAHARKPLHVHAVALDQMLDDLIGQRWGSVARGYDAVPLQAAMNISIAIHKFSMLCLGRTSAWPKFLIHVMY